MKEFGVFLAKIFLSSLLIISLFGLTVVLTASQKIDEKAIEEFIVNTASERIDERLERYTKGYENQISLIYKELNYECNTQDIVYFANEIEFVCSEIKKFSPEQFEEEVRDKINEAIKEELKSEIKRSQIYNYLRILEGALLGLGILSMVIVGILFFINEPKHEFFYNLGIIGIIVGAPFLVMGFIKDNFNLGEIYFLNSILDSLFINLFFVLVAGAIIFAFGVLVEGFHNKKRRKK